MERDLEILAEMVTIQRVANTGKAGVSKLIGYLPDEREQLAVAAVKALHGILPMAALPERWRENKSYNKTGLKAVVPEWLLDACDGWGAENDFAHLCVRHLDNLKQAAEYRRFFEKLAAFLGARRRICASMLTAGKKAAARDFAKASLKLQQVQLPKQITLAITMTCQLHCEYCISGINGLDSNREISADRLQQLFDWMQPKGINRIALTGGEPTLYRGFDTFLNQIRSRGIELVLATNGLASPKTIAALQQANVLCLTMHLTPEVLGSKLIRTYLRNAKELISAGTYVIMRCNFMDTSDDPQAFLDAAREAGIAEIRAAIPMPKSSGGNHFVMRRHLNRYAPLLDRLVAGGRLAGIEVVLAKPFPICFMSAETARYLLSNGSLAINCPVHFSGFTNNIIVHSDLRFAACLGLDHLSEKPIIAYKGLTHAAEAHRERVKTLTHQAMMPACKACPLWIGGRCVGGCLSYRITGQAEDFPIAQRGRP